MEVASQAAEVSAPAAPGDATTVRRLKVGLSTAFTRGGALLAGSVRSLAADVRIVAHGREANARSIVALMALGVEPRRSRCVAPAPTPRRCTATWRGALGDAIVEASLDAERHQRHDLRALASRPCANDAHVRGETSHRARKQRRRPV